MLINIPAKLIAFLGALIWVKTLKRRLFFPYLKKKVGLIIVLVCKCKCVCFVVCSLKIYCKIHRSYSIEWQNDDELTGKNAEVIVHGETGKTQISLCW
jgi:hypothetical protein